MPAERGRSAALTREPDPDNAGVGNPPEDLPGMYALGGFFVGASSYSKEEHVS